MSPDNTYKVKISLLQTSDSNAFFSNMVDVDRDTGNGIFPILIKDLKGGQVFSTEAAWVTKKAPFAVARKRTIESGRSTRATPLWMNNAEVIYETA